MLTDNETIKALECCGSESGDDCDNCPYAEVVYRQGEGGCTNQLMQDVHDLINRQNAENERLKADHIRVCAERDARITMLKFNKSEAYREYEGRVRMILEKRYGKGYMQNSIVIADLVNLTKELTESNE